MHVNVLILGRSDPNLSLFRSAENVNCIARIYDLSLSSVWWLDSSLMRYEYRAQLIPFCRILNSFLYLFLFRKMLQLPQLCFSMKAVTAEGFGKEWEGWQEKVVAWNHTLINWSKLSLTPFVFKVFEIPLRLNCLRLASPLCPAFFFSPTLPWVLYT